MRQGIRFKYAIITFIIFFISQNCFGHRSCCDRAGTCCDDVFGDGLQSHSASGKVLFNCGSQLLNSPENRIEAPCVGQLLLQNCSAPVCSPKTCGNATCTPNSSARYVGTLSATFPDFSGGSNVVNPTTLAPGTYDTVSIGKNATFSCNNCNDSSVNYKINTLIFTSNKTLTLRPGNYYIKNISTPAGTELNIDVNSSGGDGSGTARIFLNNGSSPAVFSTVLDWNSGSRQEASRSIIYAFQGLNITGTGDINSFIYSPLDINLGVTLGSSDLKIEGAVTARNITMGSLLKSTGNTYVTYDEDTIPDFGPITCGKTTTNQFTLSGITGSASSCTNNVLTVTAKKSDNTVDTNYTGTVVLSTQGNCALGSNCTGACTSGGTTCKGTFSVNSGAGVCTGCGGTNGYIEYTFSQGDGGIAKFNLMYPPEGMSPTNIVVFQKNDSTINGALSAISFNPAQFLVIPSTATVGALSAPASYAVSQVAGTVFNPSVKLVAYSACGSGIATNYAGNKIIQFYSTYVDPVPAKVVGNKVVVNGNAIANSSVATATTQIINFTAGVAILNSVKYSDVGKLKLTVKDNAATPVIAGSSGDIVVKPANFVISGTGIPGTTSATGPVFGKAGQPFSATVTVLASDGTVAGSFGNEIVPEKIKLQSSSLAAPAKGRNGSDNLGTIGNATALTKVSPGVFSGNTFTFDEVGSINLAARVNSGSYLSGGDVVGATTIVGRFTPDHFDVTGNTPQFATGCHSGQFTYLDQPFVYSLAPTMTVQAKASANPVSSNYITQNYNGAFKKLSPLQFPALNQDYQPGAITTPAIDKTSASLQVPTETDSGTGTLTYTFAAKGGSTGQGLRLNRPAATATPYSPFNANIQLRLTVTDTDNISYTSNPFVFGTGAGIGFNNGNQFYQGVLFMENAFGSEVASLNVPIQTKIYNGSGFVPNTADNCTIIGNTNFIVLTDPPAPQVPITTVATLPTPNLLNGASRIQLSAPLATGQKNIEVNLSSSGFNFPWLQGNWSFQPGVYGNPHAQANFGTFKGTPAIIYQRENYR